VGVRRPPQWRLLDQVLLDTDRSAPDGQRRGLTLRSRFGRVLEYTAREEFSPAGSVHTAAEWEQWLAATRKAITKQAITTVNGGALNDHQPRLIHAHCQRHTTAHGIGPNPLQHASLPSRLA
jgi:hypothetical protein